MKARLQSEQVKTLYWQSGLIVSFSPLLSAFLVLALWTIAEQNILMIWLTMQVIHSLIWDQFRRAYYRHEELHQDQSWLRKQHIALFMMGTSAGILYGLTVPLFWNAEVLEGTLVISLLLAGLNIAPFVGNAISYPVYLWVPIFSLGPLAVISMMTGGYFWFVGVLNLVGIVGFLIYAKRLSSTFNENFQLRIQNEGLVQSLRKEKEQVERASRAKTRFLAAASHDLRQPLQAQRLFAEAISARSQNSELSELAAQITESQRSMQSMLDALLDISRLDADIVKPRLVMVSLNDLFSRLVYDLSPLAENKGLHFAVRWPPQDTIVHCDQGLVESILRNLLTNAIRYTCSGTVMLALRKRGSYWRLEVRDSGIGIAEHSKQEIFEEFRQLSNPERDRTKGLGLGLSIVRRLCDLLDYPLSLYSRPDQGSVFAFQIPVNVTDEAVVVASNQMVEKVILQGLDVLVIDDEQAIRQALIKALSAYGLTVRSAANRLEALTQLKVKVPDVMVVDYRLPEHDTGGAVIALLREQAREDIPAVLLTGDTDPERLHELQAIGCPMLHKPISIEELLTSIQSVCKQSIRKSVQ